MTKQFVPFTPQDSVMLLIDYQTGTIGFARSNSRNRMVHNARALARVAKTLQMPVVLTTSLENQIQGPLLPDIQELLPEASEVRIKRIGVTNAWMDPDFRNAVLQAAGGRKNIIMAGLTNDVCIVYPSITMAQEGFNVQVVQDAGGSVNKLSEEAACRRWESYGVVSTSTNQLIAELAADWESEVGSRLVPIMVEEVVAHLGDE
ncbi:MAG: isochorismatase family protein [Ktedonobacteraceae bacterium]|nr:isochorismatase family protein [Ktedonobacteraceae bacterium]MBO0789713.1 isochorismatase family protein [Ktedonobacteraceae bacterium]